MNHLSLFSGIGGIDLAAHWAGFETVAFCEQNKFCQQVLGKHWPGVPIYDDVRTLSIETLGRTNIDLISGGFPCQDVSLAGFRQGLEGKRSTLWSEFYRIICEIKPKWVLVENVLGLLTSDNGQFFGNILRDLAQNGYFVEWGVLSASRVGALHRRERVFIIAYSTSIGCKAFPIFKRTNFETSQKEHEPWVRLRKLVTSNGLRNGLPPYSTPNRNLDGISRELDERRVNALGNAVVPQQVYPILKAIADYEMGVAA